MNQPAVADNPPGPHHGWAMALGARCDLCPLRNTHQGPVPPTVPPAPEPIEMLVIAEAPGQVEVDNGATLIGPSGREIRGALETAGFDPNRAGYTNTMMCRPPDDLDTYLQKCRRQNIPSPIDCCRPRLQAELSRAKFAILMGGASLTGTGVGGKIMRLRGTPVQIPGGPPAVPAPHAAFVLRDTGRSMRPVFRADVAKAVRISQHGSTWRDPPYHVVTEPEHLANFLAQKPTHWAVDTETDGIDAWTCGLRRIGIGTAQGVMIFSPLSVHGNKMAATALNERAIKRVFADFFARPSAQLVFHNYFGFDSIVLSQHGMPVNDACVVDTLLAHHIGPSSELPHSLDFLGSVCTDAPHWKQDVKHSNVKSDDILDRYLSFDVAVTWLAAPHVLQSVVASNQTNIYAIDAFLGAVGRNMSALGIRIDREKQIAFASEYQLTADRLRAEFIQECGKDVNPRSYPQVQRFFYQDLGLPILEDHRTDTGEPSTDEATLLDLLGLGVDRRAEKLIHSLLGFREADKVLGTYTGRVEDGQLVGGPPVHADGRLRTTWKVHGTTSGRWSSGDPVNLQNIIKRLRAMYVPEPGNVFVAADFSALELRILALLSQDEPLIEAFRLFDAGKGPDIHNANACGVFKCRSEEVTDTIRTFIKRFVYALSYGAGVPKIHQTLSLLRDDKLRPVFPGITVAEVERCFNAWWQVHPAILAWQKSLIRTWRQTGYIASAWHGRKRYFIGGENHEEMKNHPIQSSAADLQNNAVQSLLAAYPFDFKRRTGLVLQVHDQLVVECPEGDAERVKALVEGVMTQQVGPMKFPAAAKIARDWKAVS